MGPSSGVGFAAKVLQTVLDEDQPGDPDFYYLFSLNDFQQSRALEEADTLLWSIIPTHLPPRDVTDKVWINHDHQMSKLSTNGNDHKLMADYFKFTERVFPVLHRPTFLRVVDGLYQQNTIGLDRFEYLAQFYFASSIAYWFDMSLSFQEKSKYQIRALQTACRCFFTTLHKRRDGVTRLQTMILHVRILSSTLLRNLQLRRPTFVVLCTSPASAEKRGSQNEFCCKHQGVGNWFTPRWQTVHRQPSRDSNA
jgi:hypothetical protein